ncbi:MAG: polysulfide reductase NrfD [Chloroflexi bacterium]|nr:polysulfide reductase NrfD [Chloroflexota bacterium]MBU1746593.1 polysulfide reductase NrfD [Chloroflexota bacterium]MBU1877680.1 polysulfide reductase NrfD [Chloroflexota bacterium]
MPIIYLFLGGLGAGAFLVAAIMEWTGEQYKRAFCPIALVGSTISGPTLLLGVLLLVFELGAGLREPWRILYMLTNVGSVMTWGVWILSLFLPLCFLYGFLELMEVYPRTWQRFFVHRLPPLQRLPLRRIKHWVAGIGSLFAVGTAIYTGVLLSAVGPAIPFWSTPIAPGLAIPMLPILFLVSAISTGMGLTVDLAATLSMRSVEQHLHHLPVIHLVLIGLEAMLIGAMMLVALGLGGEAAQSARYILMGPLSVVFWLGVVVPGLLYPLVVHAYAMGAGSHSMASGLGSGAGLLIGGMFLRYVIVASGVPIALW